MANCLPAPNSGQLLESRIAELNPAVPVEGHNRFSNLLDDPDQSSPFQFAAPLGSDVRDDMHPTGSNPALLVNPVAVHPKPAVAGGKLERCRMLDAVRQGTFPRPQKSAAEVWPMMAE